MYCKTKNYDAVMVTLLLQYEGRLLGRKSFESHSVLITRLAIPQIMCWIFLSWSLPPSWTQMSLIQEML